MLEVKDLKVSYGAVQALDGVSLTVSDGEIVSLIGANGAGKTTALRTITGLEKAAAGSIVFDGHDLRKTEPSRIIGLKLAHVPEGRHIFPEMTVEENLEMGAYADPAGREETMQTVYARFPRLKERRRQLAGTLSGGEQQMLAVGRALMAKPRMILMDEPSMGLVAPCWSRRSLTSSRRSTSRASPSCWWSRTPGWRCPSPTGPTCWRPGTNHHPGQSRRPAERRAGQKKPIWASDPAAKEGTR